MMDDEDINALIQDPGPPPTLWGRDGHICHNGLLESAPPFSHTYVCPTGEHPMGWQHPGGDHAMCPVCQPERVRGSFGEPFGDLFGGLEGIWRRYVHHVVWHLDGREDIVLQLNSEMLEALVLEIDGGAPGIFMEM